jgi:hypothetical protein
VGKAIPPLSRYYDEGDKIIFGTAEQWGPWEPPTAGAWVHRKVLNEYLYRSQKDERLFKLGRTGKGILTSCEDSIMMRGSQDWSEKCLRSRSCTDTPS